MQISEQWESRRSGCYLPVGEIKRKQQAIKTRQGEKKFQSLSVWCCSSFLLPPPLFFLRWQIRFSDSIFASISSAVLPLHCGLLRICVMCLCVWDFRCSLRSFYRVHRAKRLTTAGNILTRYCCVSQVHLDLRGDFRRNYVGLFTQLKNLRAPHGVVGRAESRI